MLKYYLLIPTQILFALVLLSLNFWYWKNAKNTNFLIGCFLSLIAVFVGIIYYFGGSSLFDTLMVVLAVCAFYYWSEWQIHKRKILLWGAFFFLSDAAHLWYLIKIYQIPAFLPIDQWPLWEYTGALSLIGTLIILFLW